MLQTLGLVWGVSCYFYDKQRSTDETIDETIAMLKEENSIIAGDIVINTGTMPIQKRARTNMLKVTVVE